MSGTYFHAIDPNDGMFCHNIKLSSGRVTAVSYVRAAVPEWSGMRSPYEIFTRELEKEDYFEFVRASSFRSAPSRKGAIFLFASMQNAEWANVHWWNGRRVILRAEVIEARHIGAFDAKWLDAPKDSWEATAYAYWSAEITRDPQIEVLVDGIVQLCGWESFARLLV